MGMAKIALRRQFVATLTRGFAALSNPLVGKDVVRTSTFSRSDVDAVLDQATKFRQDEKGASKLLADKRVALIFYENSTRTMSSFQAAAMNLGAQVMQTWAATSSVSKGETLEDTARTMENYCDAIVLRHPEVGSAQVAAACTEIPVINAGDGPGEHPTQALLDMLLMRTERGSLDGTTVTMVGDLLHGRTVHSLVALLSLYNDITINLVSPEWLSVPSDTVTTLEKAGVKVNKAIEMEPFFEQSDFLYMTRVQKERFRSAEEYEKANGLYILTEETMKKAPSKMLVMHPMPRVNEITPSVDKDPRARYFQQPKYGVYTRMALLAMVLGAV
mmetsp:Transcript_25770/g.59482  ORF Transcript_25770/g.59482 Transcript_25770/m.59482 type:complete len:331 (+) Transcript_25770:134-1126(+)